MDTLIKDRMEMVFTETYRCNANRHKAIREAALLDVVFPSTLGKIKDDDLFAGRWPSPDNYSWDINSLGCCCNTKNLKADLMDPNIDENQKNHYQDIINFWEKENTTCKTREAYPQAVSNALPTDDWMNESGVAFPLYRIAGAYLNFDKLLQLGIPGLQLEIQNARKKVDADQGLFEGMLQAVETFKRTCQHYSEQASQLGNLEIQENRKPDFHRIAQSCFNIAYNKPQSFHEAIQLAWLWILHSGVINYGRMDIYIGDFLAKDLNSGVITEPEALRMLKSLWQIMADRKTTFNGRIIIGGRGRRNPENADRFALLAMEATRTVHEIEPQLSLRFYKGQNPELYNKAISVIGEGRTFPMLYNDDINIPSVKNAFDISEQEAENYLPLGCGEYALDHRSIHSPNGVINLVKALEITLHNGVDPVSGKRMGLALGTFDSFRTFDDLWNAYKKQVEYFVDALALQQEIEYDICGKDADWLFTSILYDDCISRGKSVFGGGIRYLGGTLETYGNVNTSDSLYAIKKLVYDTRSITPSQMLLALDADFIGFDQEHRMMLSCAKYGNDKEDVDEMAIKVHDHICNVTRDQRTKTGMHSYLVVIINNHANTTLGRLTAASADGRKSGMHMANANNPMSGMDKNGITAFLNSIVKLDPAIHAGSVQNMKFSPEMFTPTMRPKLEALLHTYFTKGGTQAMVSVVRRGDLEAAIKEPEKYQNLMIRVGGFSARFVELMKDVQIEILNRTLY